MSSIYMCLSYNERYPILCSLPRFYIDYYSASIDGVQRSKKTNETTFYVCIYKFPIGKAIPMFEPPEFDPELSEYHVKTIRNSLARNLINIQRFYRIRFYIKTVAATLIQKVYREAIANPYKLLCKNRLNREFNEMKN